MNNLQAFIKNSKNVRRLLRSIKSERCEICPAKTFCKKYTKSGDCSDKFTAWALAEHKPRKKKKTIPFSTTGYILRNREGTVVCVFPDTETMEANVPYGKHFNEEMNRKTYPPPWSLQEVTVFTATEHNPVIQTLIHQARSVQPTSDMDLAVAVLNRVQ